LIPDIEKFLPVAIFKMATTISHKFNIVWFQRPELIPDIEKFLPVSIFKMATTKIQHCSISKVAFDLFFKPIVSGQPRPRSTLTKIIGLYIWVNIV
jgi:hypothetical protein